MAKTMKRLLCAALAIVMSMSMICITASAAQEINGNTWYGDQLNVNVTAGEAPYTFMSLFRKPASGYEFSGHATGGEMAQTFVVIDTVEHNGTSWTPSGIYDPMSSNYEVTYCCDVETMIVDGTYYKRTNLEDSGYYNAAQAAKIRAIVTNAYPYVSLEAMKADLAKNGFAYADNLTRNEIIAAVQAAIWASANSKTAADFKYEKSYRVADNYQWGQPLHDTSDEAGLDVKGTRVFKTYEDVGARIDALTEYLLGLNASYATKAQIVINKLEMNGEPVQNADGTVTVKLDLELNNSGSGYQDNINITVRTGDKEAAVIPVELGTENYSLTVTANRNDKITAVVSGTQVLPKGVYFYAPKATETTSSRKVSQNLVGVAMGETPVYADASIDLSTVKFPPKVSFESGTASNISFMLIDENGNVEFLQKYDIDQTSYEIPYKPGYISAVFIKQAQSGMVWISQEVDDAVVENVVDCIKNNNPSYKGHDAVAFGEGDHELTFKKNHTVTYSFNNISAIDNVVVTLEEPVEETEPEETMPEETEPEATEPEVTEPEVTEPEVTEPEVTEPEVTEPEVTEPEVTEPEVTEPEVTEPEETVEETEPEETEEKNNNGKGNGNNKDKKDKKDK